MFYDVNVMFFLTVVGLQTLEAAFSVPPVAYS